MKSILQKIADENKICEEVKAEDAREEAAAPFLQDNRRGFLKKAALGGISMAGLMNLSIEDSIAYTTSKVRRSSNPSALKITDMRYCVVENRRPIIRIETNQGIHGLGEVRDGADWRYAMILKSRIL